MIIKNKSSLLFVLFLFLLTLFLESGVYAQSPTPERIVYTCLNVQHCKQTVAGSENCTKRHSHRVRLTQSNASIEQANNANTFVVECFSLVINGQPKKVCTTGNPNLDSTGGFTQSDGTTNFDLLTQRLRYGTGPGDASEPTRIFNTTSGTEVEMNLGNPGFYSIDAQGRLQISGSTNTNTIIEWRSATPETLPRAFAIVTKYSSQAQATGPTPPQGGLQQGDLSFVSSCQTVSYDPLGYAYDIQTGDPVPNINITASYSQTESGPYITATEGLNQTDVFPPGTLPIKTNNSGFYSFFGKIGWYKMTLDGIPGTHLTRSQVSSILPAVSSLYPLNLNYYFDESFYEGPVLKTLHLPISINPGENTYSLGVVSLEETEKGKIIDIRGQTTGPANVTVNICRTIEGVKNCRPQPYKTLNPTNGGPRPSNYFKFNMILDQTILEANEKFEFTVTKYELSLPPAAPAASKFIDFLISKIFKPINAQEQSVSFSVAPIPSYLEGFLYDSEGRILKNTEFGIFVSYNSDPYFLSKTDSNGFYRITSEFLPNTSFVVSYINPNTNIKETLETTQILAQNQEFIIQERINSYNDVTQTNNPRRNITPSFVPRQNINLENTIISPTQSATNNVDDSGTDNNSGATNSTNLQNNLLPIIVAFVLLIIIIVGVTVYIVKKRQTTTKEDIVE